MEKQKLNILQRGTDLTHKIHFLIVTQANGNCFPHSSNMMGSVNKHFFTRLQEASPTQPYDTRGYSQSHAQFVLGRNSDRL